MSAHADVKTLGANMDTAIVNGSNQNNSNGGGPLFFAGTDGNSAIHRGLISFDFSSIPAGSTITNVQLTLTLGQVAGGSTFTTATIGLFDVTQSWSAGTVSSVLTTATSTSGAGSGAAANTGDATWNAAHYSPTAPALWTVAGGDHATTASTSLFLPSNSVGTAFTWLSTSQLVADVQGWLNAPATNFGWELINANESASKTIYGFYGSEWHNYVAAGGSASQEPALQVTFTAPVPEPAGGLLLGVAAFTLLSLRRRA